MKDVTEENNKILYAIEVLESLFNTTVSVQLPNGDIDAWVPIDDIKEKIASLKSSIDRKDDGLNNIKFGQN